MARINGLNADDLIENPSGIIESLERDEIHAERDLILDYNVTTSDIIISGAVNSTPLRSTVNDYYNNAYIVNVTKNERYLITDYVGSTRTLTVWGSPVAWVAGNKCYIKNIKCEIDANSFDVVGANGTMESGTTSATSAGKLVDSGKNFVLTVLPGMRVKNTTDATYSYVKTIDSGTQLTLENDIMASGEGYEIYGVRKDWKFARSLNSQQYSNDILAQLCFEANLIRFKSYDKIKIKALEDGETCGTFSIPIKERGRTLVSYGFTPLSNIYTSFVLNYDYDYTKKIYKKQVLVDKNSVTNAYLNDMKTYCSDAETNYKVNRKYEYNSDWIHDDTTAYYFMERLVKMFTYQRMVVSWTGNIGTYIKYEIGNRVLINLTYMMPTVKNNAQVFLITRKTIDLKKKVVSFNLIY